MSQSYYKKKEKKLLQNINCTLNKRKTAVKKFDFFRCLSQTNLCHEKNCPRNN